MSQEVPEVCKNCEKGQHELCDGKTTGGKCSCVICQ